MAANGSNRQTAMPQMARQEGAKTSRAQRSRDGTRAKLLWAAEQVVAENGVDSTTIGAITSAADVAVGSFYNHFTSKIEIAELIFSVHAQQLAQVNNQVFNREPDPALAVAYIQKLFLTRAVADPVWGWFVVRATNDIPRVTNAFAADATRHIEIGIEAGRFHTASVPVVVRILLISLIAGMRDILEGGVGRDRPNRIVQSHLQMLGLPLDEAGRLADTRLPAYTARLFTRRG